MNSSVLVALGLRRSHAPTLPRSDAPPAEALSGFQRFNFSVLNRFLSVAAIAVLCWSQAHAADPTDDRGAMRQKGSARADTARKSKPSEQPVFSPIPSGGSFSITNPIIIITPAKLDFGYVSAGKYATNTFLVENAGHGKLSGKASVPPPFKIEAGGSFTLKEKQAQVVTVTYTPKDAQADAAAVSFTAGETTVKATVVGRRLPPKE